MEREPAEAITGLMMNETASRETYRIKGETMITVHDYNFGPGLR